MLNGTVAIIKHQFAVFAVGVQFKEALITYRGAIFHMHDQVVTLAFIAAHQSLSTMDPHNTALCEADGTGTGCYVSDFSAAMTSNNINSPKGKIGLCHVVSL
ncbi:Uncharacterised protein [Serratia fonticola]|nr:Uncharacterised protein [Serratia fonticola]CAI2023790.1 Uncharacterised protein [Serratia fonticola]CAI2538067.1 Uncharacterised protein [Serratia fonticola]